MKYNFDKFTFDAERFELQDSDGTTIELQPRSLELLGLLLRNSGALVDKETAQNEIWSGLHTSPDAMRTQVRKLRAALGDTDEPHRLIETVHGKGLRFVGDVVVEGDESASDGINVEEHLAPNSGAVRSEPRQKPMLSAYAVLAGIMALVVLGITLGVRIDLTSAIATTQAADEETYEAAVAVLPFREIGMQSDQSYIGEGLANELTSVLARIDGLKVPSSSSAFRFTANEGQSLSETAEALGVSHVVEGSVAREDGSLKVTVHLVDAINDDRIWTETYSRLYDATNIVRIQEQIASAIVAEMLGELAPETEELLAKTDSTEALEYYLQAQPLMRDQSDASVNQAIDLLKRAIDADPEYVDAYSLLFFAYNAAYYIGGLPGDELPQTRDLALEKAVELDPNDPRVLQAVGFTELITGRPREAIATLQQSLIGEPNNVRTLHIIAGAYGALGRAIEEREFLRKARQLDPLSPRILYDLAKAEFNLGDTPTAMEVARTNMRWNSDHPRAQQSLASLLFQVGDYTASHELFRLLYRRNPTNYGYTRQITHLYLTVGWESQAERAAASMPYIKAELDAILSRREEVDRFLADNQEFDMNGDDQGVMYFYLRDFETALPFMKRAIEELEVTGPAGLGWNEMLWYLAHAHVLRDAGDPEGDAIMEKLEEALSGQTPQSADNFSVFMTSAGVEMLRGNEGKAIDWLEAALEAGHTFADLQYNPTFDDLQDNPRYLRLLAKMEAKASEYRVEFQKQINSKHQEESELESVATL